MPGIVREYGKIFVLKTRSENLKYELQRLLIRRSTYKAISVFAEL